MVQSPFCSSCVLLNEFSFYLLIYTDRNIIGLNQRIAFILVISDGSFFGIWL